MMLLLLYTVEGPVISKAEELGLVTHPIILRISPKE